MRRLLSLLLISASLVSVSFNASATSTQAAGVTINGLYYTLYNKTPKCPDNSAKVLYKGQYYCHTYQVKLSWNAPSTRVDGAPLPMSDLAGYEVYWTRSLDKASGVITVPVGSTTAATFYTGTLSTYYFAVSALDSKGLKSPLSAMVSTVVKLGHT